MFIQSIKVLCITSIAHCNPLFCRCFLVKVSLQIDRKYCLKSVRIRSYSAPHFPTFGLNTERYSVSLHIRSKCGKMRTRITPNKDTFYAVRWMAACFNKFYGQMLVDFCLNTGKRLFEELSF